MKKKYIYTILCLAMSLLLILCFTSCKRYEDEDIAYYEETIVTESESGYIPDEWEGTFYNENGKIVIIPDDSGYSISCDITTNLDNDDSDSDKRTLDIPMIDDYTAGEDGYVFTLDEDILTVEVPAGSDDSAAGTYRRTEA